MYFVQCGERAWKDAMSVLNIHHFAKSGAGIAHSYGIGDLKQTYPLIHIGKQGVQMNGELHDFFFGLFCPLLDFFSIVDLEAVFAAGFCLI